MREFKRPDPKRINVAEQANDQEKIVQSYYLSLDEGNIGQALSIFSDSIVYRRGENVEIRGIEKLKDFYANLRKIKSGIHQHLQFYSKNQAVMVIGNFLGELKDGEQVSVRFMDNFFFDDKGKVVKRFTSYPDGKEI